MDDYIERWVADLMERVDRGETLRSPMEVTGERDRFVSAAGWQRARVTASLEPAERFEVIDRVESSPELRSIRYPDSFVFGLLDEILVGYRPIVKVRVTLTSAVYDRIHSSVLAFRLAGRDAGQKVLAAFYKRRPPGASDNKPSDDAPDHSQDGWDKLSHDAT